MPLVTGSAAYNWYYDWSAIAKNDASYLVEFRQYNLPTIPATVPWKPYLPGVPFPRLAPSGSTAYWSFATWNPSASILADLSGNLNHFKNVKSTVEVGALWVSRRDLFTILGGGTTGYNLSSSVPVTFDRQSFSWETYVYGIDATLQDNALLFIATGSTSGVNKGYSITFDFTSKNLYFQVGSGSNSGRVSASINALQLESGFPPNYHYFAGTHAHQQGLFLYIDGNLAAYTPYSGSVGPYPEKFLVKQGKGLYVDEFCIYDGFLDANTAAAKYMLTKERQRYLAMSRGTYQAYHQARFTAFASGSNEFELHSFSVRGLQETSASILDPRTTDNYVLPLFSSVSGSTGQAIGGISY